MSIGINAMFTVNVSEQRVQEENIRTALPIQYFSHSSSPIDITNGAHSAADTPTTVSVL
jgi:hypothetical protein